MLRHRAHARHLAAARHGRPEEAAPVLVHRQRARRHSAARREPAAPDEDHARRQRVGGHRHLEVRLAHARRGARARRQHPRGLEDNLYLPERRDGEVERRARRGRGAHGPRRGPQGRDGRAGAADPRPRSVQAHGEGRSGAVATA